ncbi:MAG TPA: DNA-3-methyladenine glycosylase [Candidatus Saccharimonadales bacterium]|nr:DNA-3-methyladenine glycosylase [Candidatus Saccharimonadales bacterium]
MLPESFFNQKVEELANALLGCELVHETAEGTTAGVIVEVESYHQSDEASHSYKSRSPRTEVMFGPPGHAYIYFTYGMHWCFNVVAEEKGVGAGVLVRALEPTRGIELMINRRYGTKSDYGSRGSGLSARRIFSLSNGARRTSSTGKGVTEKKNVDSADRIAEFLALPESRQAVLNLTNGPAKLVQAMGITKADYGKPLYKGNLYITEPKLKDIKIAFGPRVGISKAKEKPWRFWIEDSLFVSGQPKR